MSNETGEVLEVMGETENIKTLKEYKEEFGDICELFVVYGTLRKGGSNNGLFGIGVPHLQRQDTGSIHLGRFRTEPKFKMYSLGGFPGVVHEEKDPIGVVCDVYLVRREDVKTRLDMLEGYRGEEYNDPNHASANFYNKEEIDTPWGKGWIYIYNSSPRQSLNVIKTGDWLNQNK